MTDKKGIKDLAQQAAHYLLTQQPMPITHEAGWKREGFPLPIKRMAANEDGTISQEYRPLAVLEYVHEVLSGVIASKAATIRKAKKDAAP